MLSTGSHGRQTKKDQEIGRETEIAVAGHYETLNLLKEMITQNNGIFLIY